MKRILLLLLAFAYISPSIAGDKDKKAPAKTGDDEKIHWLSIDDVQVEMRKKPKKVFMDVYTDWCGWCKVMDTSTFHSPEVVKYINDNFYAVKFNAERKDSIRFAGQMFGFAPEYRAHMLAIQLLQGKMSYPTSVIIEENFQRPMVYPGYLNVTNIERFLKFANEGHYKTVPFDTFAKNFIPVWQPRGRG